MKYEVDEKYPAATLSGSENIFSCQSALLSTLPIASYHPTSDNIKDLWSPSEKLVFNKIVEDGFLVQGRPLLALTEPILVSSFYFTKRNGHPHFLSLPTGKLIFLWMLFWLDTHMAIAMLHFVWLQTLCLKFRWNAAINKMDFADRIFVTG